MIESTKVITERLHSRLNPFIKIITASCSDLTLEVKSVVIGNDGSTGIISTAFFTNKLPGCLVHSLEYWLLGYRSLLRVNDYVANHYVLLFFGVVLLVQYSNEGTTFQIHQIAGLAEKGLAQEVGALIESKPRSF